MLRRLWRDHSLTIVLATIGAALLGAAFVPGEGKTFDVLLTFGSGLWLLALLNVLSGPLRERNKPEE